MVDRRQAGTGMMRRKRYQAGEPTPRDLLGPSVVEYWDSRYGYTLVGDEVSGWSGQLLGTVLNAPSAAQRPGYVVSAEEFAGRPAVRCYLTDGKILDRSALAIAIGARPYIVAITRQRAVPVSYAGGHRRKWFVSSAVHSLGVRINGDGVGQTAWDTVLTSGSHAAVVASAHSLDTHCDEHTLDAAAGSRWYRDGALSATSPTALGTFAGPITRITLGSVFGSSAQAVDVDFGQFVICTETPTAAHRADYLAYARERWGVQ